MIRTLVLIAISMIATMWKQYEDARSRDLPEEQLRILESIKKEAKAAGAAWDYYDACDKYLSVSSSRDWKLYKKLYEERDREIEGFGAPVGVFYLRHSTYRAEGLDKYVEENRESLQNARNKEFYSQDRSVTSLKFGSVLCGIIGNDYEYALWSLRDTAALGRQFKGRYPMEQFARYTALTSIRDPQERRSALEKYADAHKGKAVALLAEEDLLSLRLADEGSTSEDYIRLKNDCEDLIRRRNAFKGEEKETASCCKRADEIVRILDSKALYCEIRDGKLLVTLTNLQEAGVSIRNAKEELWRKSFPNTVRSYFKPDSLLFELPPIDDGEYTLEAVSGQIKEETTYRKHTLSAAVRRTGDGIAVYVTDYMSGKPEESVDIQICKGKETICSVKGMKIDGFTEIPGSGDIPDDATLTLKCSTVRDGIRRTSDDIRFRKPYQTDTDDDLVQIRAEVLTDRGAYTPGETVRFKVITYTGIYSLNNAGNTDGLRAVLTDTEGNRIAVSDLKAGPSGTADGMFRLNGKSRGGIWSIEIEHNGNRIGSRQIRVDEFVPPTFIVTFDGPESFPLDAGSIFFTGTAKSYTGHPIDTAAMTYSIERYGQKIASGNVLPDSDGRFRIDLKLPEEYRQGYGWFSITVRLTESDGETLEFSSGATIMRSDPETPQREYCFEELEGIGMRIVAGDKPTWAAFELFGAGNVLLEHGTVHFLPAGGPAETTVSLPFKDSYPGTVTLHVLYFQNGSCHKESLTRERKDHRYDLPLAFSRFTDLSSPRRTCTFTVRTNPGAECAVTVYDKGTDDIMSGMWSPLTPSALPAPSLYYSYSSGHDEAARMAYSEVKIRGRSGVATMAANDAVPFQLVESKASFDAGGQNGGKNSQLRENFANTLYWEPALIAGNDGLASFSFEAMDKLSTYKVQVFAIDRSMRNNTAQREMTVTIPVKISVNEPQLLYAGDRYDIIASVSNNSGKNIAGILKATLFDGNYRDGRSLSQSREQLDIPASGTARAVIPVVVPETDSLGIMLEFESGEFRGESDAVFVPVPVRKPEQSLVEAHSAILGSGENKDALVRELRNEFVNVDGNAAEITEISIAEMLGKVIPEEVRTKSDNAIELARALYADELCRKLGKKGCSSTDKAAMTEKLLACINQDCGFGWFPGMSSSPVVTAMALKILHNIGDRAIPADKITGAVKYLDNAKFGKEEMPVWRGWLTLGQYLHIRALHASVPFETKDIDRKRFKEFKAEAAKYLTPRSERGLNGMILAKARRILTLKALESSEDGRKLAAAWGISVRRSSKSETADKESLIQYAVSHKSGGKYYPNAVMPWRGLMESELYAHNLLCELLDGYEDSRCKEIADGIRLWIMVQKETQSWKSDPAFIESAGLVLNGGGKLLETRVIALKAAYSSRFQDIKASGNGMAMTCGTMPDTLKIGDKVTLQWTVENEENRSFVHITLPFNAAFQPVDRMSGYRMGGYRNVTAGQIEYWFDCYPEGSTTVTEEFFVSREGEFQTPAAIVESQYAPHYRANTKSIKTNTLQQ